METQWTRIKRKLQVISETELEVNYDQTKMDFLGQMEVAS